MSRGASSRSGRRRRARAGRTPAEGPPGAAGSAEDGYDAAADGLDGAAADDPVDELAPPRPGPRLPDGTGRLTVGLGIVSVSLAIVGGWIESRVLSQLGQAGIVATVGLLLLVAGTASLREATAIRRQVAGADENLRLPRPVELAWVGCAGASFIVLAVIALVAAVAVGFAAFR